MNIKISKKTRRIVLIYIAILAILYIVAFVIPDLTDIFDSTMTLENDTLEVSCESEGYLVKEEAVCTAEETGDINYKVTSGTVVKKGSNIAEITATSSKSDSEAEDSEDESNESEDKTVQPRKKYNEYLNRLKKYDLNVATNKAPISGVFSTTIDGYEKYFSIDNLNNITKEKTEERLTSQLELERTDVREGEPIYKISNDDYWYIVSWIEKTDAKKFETGAEVRIELPEGTVDGKIESIEKEGELYKMTLFLNAYYKEFCSAREVSMKVIQSDTVGLIVDNECLIEKDGQTGVYVKSKDDDVYFMPVKVKISNGEQSVLYESVFVDDDYKQVETVSVYQEVLRHPEDALEKELEQEANEKNGEEE